MDAQRWLDEVTASVVTGTYVDPGSGRITFEAYFRQWAARQVWAEGTVLAATQAADSVPFSQTPMSAIRPSHVQSWVTDHGSAASSVPRRPHLST